MTPFVRKVSAIHNSSPKILKLWKQIVAQTCSLR